MPATKKGTRLRGYEGRMTRPLVSSPFLDEQSVELVRMVDRGEIDRAALDEQIRGDSMAARLAAEFIDDSRRPEGVE